MTVGDYTITAQKHVNRYNPETSSIDSGWIVSARDNATQVPFDVFVPDNMYPQQANTMLLAQVDAIRQVHALTG